MATIQEVAPFADQAWSSGNLSNASAVATIPAVVDQYGVLTSVIITGGGASAASLVNMTIAGLKAGTITLPIPVASGVTAPMVSSNGMIIWTPPNELVGSAVNTAITVTLPTLGTGSTNSAVVALGHYRGQN